MSNTEYILASKQITAFRKLEAIANNVANANTNGFKAQDVQFAEFLKKDKYDNASFAKIRSSNIDFTDGALKRTDNPLDLAINGEGFFLARTPNGDMLTRDGSLKLNADGTIVNQAGFPVLTADMQLITLDETATNLVIGDDGTIFSGTQELGKIGIVSVDNPSQNLTNIGNNAWKSKIAPQPTERARVLQGFVEASNVNAIREIASLAELQRETTGVTHLMHDNFGLVRNAIKSYSRGS